MELSPIHNYLFPGGFRGLETIKKKKKVLGPNDWSLRRMLLKLLYITAVSYTPSDAADDWLVV